MEYILSRDACQFSSTQSIGYWSRDACQSGSVLLRDSLCQGTLANSHSHRVLDFGQGTLARLAQILDGIIFVKGRLPIPILTEYWILVKGRLPGYLSFGWNTLCQGTLANSYPHRVLDFGQGTLARLA